MQILSSCRNFLLLRHAHTAWTSREYLPTATSASMGAMCRHLLGKTTEKNDLPQFMRAQVAYVYMRKGAKSIDTAPFCHYITSGISAASVLPIMVQFYSNTRKRFSVGPVSFVPGTSSGIPNGICDTRRHFGLRSHVSATSLSISGL